MQQELMYQISEPIPPRIPVGAKQLTNNDFDFSCAGCMLIALVTTSASASSG